MRLELKTAKEYAFGVVCDAAFTVINPKVERLMPEIRVNYHNSYAERIKNAFNSGHQIILIGNHESHPDGLSMAAVAKKTTEVVNEIDTEAAQSFRGFRIPFATSFKDGRQGVYLEKAFKRLVSIAEGYNLFGVVYSRKDKEGSSLNRAALEGMLKAQEQNVGIAILPEGTVEAGRTQDDGSLGGVQSTGESNLRIIISALDRPEKGRTTIYAPMTLEGARKIYNPTRKYPWWKRVRDTFRFLQPEELAAELNIVVHQPFTSEELRFEAALFGVPKKNYAHYAAREIMKTTAKSLPPELQGVYRGMV